MHIEHLAIWVRDLERMRHFYERYFGAVANDKYVNPRKGFSSYFLSFPNGGPRLEIMQMTGVADSQHTGAGPFIGLTHLAFSVGGDQAVDSLTEQLRADGITILGEPRRTGDGYYESVVLDPEGNQLEITA